MVWTNAKTCSKWKRKGHHFVYWGPETKQKQHRMAATFIGAPKPTKHDGLVSLTCSIHELFVSEQLAQGSPVTISFKREHKSLGGCKQLRSGSTIKFLLHLLLILLQNRYLDPQNGFRFSLWFHVKTQLKRDQPKKTTHPSRDPCAGLAAVWAFAIFLLARLASGDREDEAVR